MMKKYLIVAILTAGGTFATNCQTVKSEPVGQNDLIADPFPEAQQEILQVMDDIGQSIIQNDMDLLISFHAYGPKFTEFKNGEPRNGAKENEDFERSFLGSFTGIHKWETDDLKVAVYGDVANVTFHSNFRPIIQQDTLNIRAQVTLLFVNTPEGWKITHEHHSALNQ